MPFDSAQGDPHHAPAEGVPEPATPEPTVIETIAALTRDGSFSHWKRKVQLHRGLAPERRKKMIDYLLENS